MGREALLNPPLEASVCRRMMDSVRSDIEAIERELTRVVTDREQYLLKMGRLDGLRKALMDLTSIYEREFEV